MPAAQGETIHLPPTQAMASLAFRQCGSDLAGTQASPGCGSPVSHVRAEPTPRQCPGPRQGSSMRHCPPAHVSAARASAVQAIESRPGLQGFPTAAVPGAGRVLAGESGRTRDGGSGGAVEGTSSAAGTVLAAVAGAGSDEDAASAASAARSRVQPLAQAVIATVRAPATPAEERTPRMAGENEPRGRHPVNLGTRRRNLTGQLAETGATHTLFRASEPPARLTRSNLMPTCPPRMRSLVVSLSGVAFLLGVAGCRSSEDAAAATRQREAAAAVHVSTVAVVERPMPEFLTLTGTLRASAQSDVAADVSGKVVQTFVERGQAVKKGQTIAIVDARAAALAATAAQAQSKVAQEQLDAARRDCERVKHLLETGAISQAEFDRQTSQCSSQQWSAAAAQAQQQSAAKLVGDANIRAPFDGFVGERYINVGQYVQPNTRVASVYAPDPLRLELTVPEANVAAIRQDMPVSFTVTAYGEQPFTGSVKYISPNLRESTRDLVIEAVVPNGDFKLKPGMFAVARIELGAKPHVVVPKASVVTDETSSHVYIVTSAQVQERLVQLGESAGDVVTVVDGVKAGEKVVVQPGPDVRDGAQVD